MRCRTDRVLRTGPPRYTGSPAAAARGSGAGEGPELAAALAGLLGKYVALVRLADARAALWRGGVVRREGAAGAARGRALRAVARAHPGALRELAALPPAVLAGRCVGVRRELARAGRGLGRPARRWVRVALAFHRALAAELARRAGVVGRGAGCYAAGGTPSRRAWEQVAREMRWPVDELRRLLFGVGV